MADLSITASAVAPAESTRHMRTRPAGAAVDAGAPVYLDASGFVREASANADATENAIGIAVTSAAAANLPVSYVGPDGLVDLGNALGSLAQGAAVYLSNTAGNLADAAGSATVVMGWVEPVYASTTADKLLRVNGALSG